MGRDIDRGKRQQKWQFRVLRCPPPALSACYLLHLQAALHSDGDLRLVQLRKERLREVG